MFLRISCSWVTNRTIVIPITSTAARIWVPPIPVSGIGQKVAEIFAPNSVALRSDSIRSGRSTKMPIGMPCEALLSTQNSDRKIGICSSSGRQDAIGLTPSSLYSFIVSWPRRSRSWPYFSCRARCLGPSSCILREELICLTKSGISRVRISIVSRMIDSAQVTPAAGSRKRLKNEWKATSTPETAQYSGDMMVLKKPPMSDHRSIGSSRGSRFTILTSR